MKTSKTTTPNHDDGHCPVESVLKIIGGKWTILIIRDLLKEKKRFGELQASLHGISPRTLSLRLDELEEHQIIQRKVFAEIPLHVEYSLTEKGRALAPILEQMEKWSKCHQMTK